MNSRPAVSSICCACGQRGIFNVSRPQLAKLSSIQPTQHTRLPLRSLSTTARTHAKITSLPSSAIEEATTTNKSGDKPSSQTAEDIETHTQPSSNRTSSPLGTPGRASPSKLEQQKAKPKLFTATVTSIHNLTAHATYMTQYWDPKFGRYYMKKEHALVHDPFSHRLLKHAASQKTASSGATASNITASTSAASAPTNKPTKATTKPKPSSSSAPTAGPAPPGPSTPSEIALTLSHSPPSLLRISDIIQFRPMTPSELAIQQSRRIYFSDLELTRKLKAAGKHRKQIVNEHVKRKAKRTRTNGGLRFVVERVLSAFGEGMEERVGVLASKLGVNASVVVQAALKDGAAGDYEGEKEAGTGAGFGSGTAQLDGTGLSSATGQLQGLDQTVVMGGERLAWWKRREQRGRIAK